MDILGPIQRVAPLRVGALGYVEGLIIITHELIGRIERLIHIRLIFVIITLQSVRGVDGYAFTRV